MILSSPIPEHVDLNLVWKYQKSYFLLAGLKVPDRKRPFLHRNGVFGLRFLHTTSPIISILLSVKTVLFGPELRVRKFGNSKVFGSNIFPMTVPILVNLI